MRISNRDLTKIISGSGFRPPDSFHTRFRPHLCSIHILSTVKVAGLDGSVELR